MENTILVIDDDEKLNQLLHSYLEGYGFRVLMAYSPSEGFKAIKKHSPDLIILDIMLPEMDGLEACKKIRKDSDTPIIMLTARGETSDRILGLEMGADDYLAKPFEPRELVARIKSVLRRGRAKSKSSIKFGDLQIDYQKQTTHIKNKRISLTNAEFLLLKFLTENPGRVFDRDQLLDELRGLEWDAFNRSVDVLVSRLRQKLGDDPKNPTYIKTIWGAGYAFIAGE
jgi:DNA-binding response OmpR family regulator